MRKAVISKEICLHLQTRTPCSDVCVVVCMCNLRLSSRIFRANNERMPWTHAEWKRGTSKGMRGSVLTPLTPRKPKHSPWRIPRVMLRTFISREGLAWRLG